MEKQVVCYVKKVVKKVCSNFKDPFFCAFVLGLMVLPFIGPEISHAALPWETPLAELESSLTGNVATMAAVITVCVCGVMLAMGEGGQFGRLAIKIIMGLSMALCATQFILIFKKS